MNDMTKREIDLHGMDVPQAKKCLDSYIAALPRGEFELDVIHGFNRGSALKKFVYSYKNKRVSGTLLNLNCGVTTLIIK